MMVVASARATMASQLRKGTVQLNVLEEEIKTQRNKQPVNRRRGKAQPARRVGVSGAVLILPNINNLIWTFLTVPPAGTRIARGSFRSASLQAPSGFVFAKMLSSARKRGSKVFQTHLKCF